MASSGASRAILLVAMILAAGCVDGPGAAKAFDPIAAPIWEPGYSWTYSITSARHESVVTNGQVEGETERNRATETMRVFNTTTPFMGEDVYYVSLSRAGEHPSPGGEIQAISKSTLAVAGRGWTPVPPERVVVADERLEPAPTKDPCGATTTIYPMDPAGRIPVLRFPLDDGQSFSDEVRDPDDEFAWTIRYTTRVHGLVPVTVGAGTFQAVYASIDFLAEIPPAVEEYGPPTIRARAEYWYSPDALNIVKSVFSYHGDGYSAREPESRRYAFSNTMSLDAYDLTPGPDGPAPVVAEPKAVQSIVYRNLEIVTDTSFPINVGESAERVTFGLDFTDDLPYAEHRPRVVNEMKPVDIDPALHRVHWRLNGAHYPSNTIEGYGDTFTVDLAKAGVFTIQADLEPVECGGSWIGSGTATISAFWQKTFTVPMDVGLPRNVPVATFPVEGGATEGSVTWKMTPTYGPALDSGRPVVYDPAGRVVLQPSSSQASSHRLSPYLSGPWRLNWESQGPTVGDDVVITLRIDYGNTASYLGP